MKDQLFLTTSTHVLCINYTDWKILITRIVFDPNTQCHPSFLTSCPIFFSPMVVWCEMTSEFKGQTREVRCHVKTMMKREACEDKRWVLEQDSSLVLHLTRELYRHTPTPTRDRDDSRDVNIPDLSMFPTYVSLSSPGMDPHHPCTSVSVK